MNRHYLSDGRGAALGIIADARSRSAMATAVGGRANGDARVEVASGLPGSEADKRPGRKPWHPASLRPRCPRNGRLGPTPNRQRVIFICCGFRARSRSGATRDAIRQRTAEYVAVIRWPDGHEDIGRPPDAESYRTLLRPEQQLQAAHWHRSGPPVILPDGWPDKRPEPVTLRRF
jgi:hypothetical protein